MNEANNQLSTLEGRLAAAARAVAPLVVEHRRALHRIPELAFEERETAAYVERTLRGLALAPRVGIAGTGIAVELPGAGPGPTVLLRADMDGLPLDEVDGRDLRSAHPGRMHACGHDAHVAAALGAAHALARLGGERLPGRIVLLFQPGEEHGAGGKRVVETGLLDEMGVDFALAMHVWSFLERGRAIVPSGPTTASSNEFQVTLTARGGHAAAPHLAHDLVLAAAQLVAALHTVVSRDVDPLKPAVLSIGHLAAGDTHNILPGKALLRGTLRAADQETRATLIRRVREIAAAVAAAHGAQADVFVSEGYLATVNDARAAEALAGAARTTLGAEAVAPGPMTMVAEDFSFIADARPAALMLLGMSDPRRGTDAPHHSPRFLVDDDVPPIGLEILLRAAARLMER